MKNKSNRIVIVLSLIFVILAIGFIILGFAISGANILAWFGSKWALWFYLFLGIYLLVILYVFIADRIKKLWVIKHN